MYAGQIRGPFITEKHLEGSQDGYKEGLLDINRAERKMFYHRNYFITSAHVFFSAINTLRNIYYFLLESKCVTRVLGTNKIIMKGQLSHDDK